MQFNCKNNLQIGYQKTLDEFCKTPRVKQSVYQNIKYVYTEIHEVHVFNSMTCMIPFVDLFCFGCFSLSGYFYTTFYKKRHGPKGYDRFFSIQFSSLTPYVRMYPTNQIPFEIDLLW